jgi:hypothetical protein
MPYLPDADYRENPIVWLTKLGSEQPESFDLLETCIYIHSLPRSFYEITLFLRFRGLYGMNHSHINTPSLVAGLLSRFIQKIDVRMVCMSLKQSSRHSYGRPSPTTVQTLSSCSW